MKQLVLILAGVATGVIHIASNIINDYRYEKEFAQQWELADKASTIPAKQERIAAFVSALEKGYTSGKMASHNAVFLETPNNEFAANLNALKTLSARLEQIQGMNPSSFEYNTAIQQITAQEQGEAKAMLGVFEGCWFLANHPFNWDWIAIAIGVGYVAMIVAGLIWAAAEYG